MHSLNSVLLEGSLVSDPELSYTESGIATCDFTLVSTREWEQDDQKLFEKGHFHVRTELRLAEVCAEYLKKGRGVRVVGRLKSIGTDKPLEILILAEHVEFKPTAKKEPSDA